MTAEPPSLSPPTNPNESVESARLAPSRPTPRPNPLATAGLDRVSDQRQKQEWVAAQWASPEARVQLQWRGTYAIVGDRSVSVSPRDVAGLRNDVMGDTASTSILLGLLGGVPHFGLDVSTLEREDVDALVGPDAVFMSLRDGAGVLHADDSNLLATTSGITTWHAKHRFCGVCGSPTEARAAGHERHCSTCGTTHFPRTDPAVIMLVTDGDLAVLGRQKIWPVGMFSTLAGFVEPGESLEDAVVREVFEEVGLRCDGVTYSSSQPWPFPQSLMVGFHATAITTDLAVHPTELDDARWFLRADLDESRRLGRRGYPIVPPPMTIARRLLDEWLDD